MLFKIKTQILAINHNLLQSCCQDIVKLLSSVLPSQRHVSVDEYHIRDHPLSFCQHRVILATSSSANGSDSSKRAGILMSGAASTVADSEESVMETSTAPTTPDGSLSFSPVLQPTQLLDHFDGILASAGTPTPTIRGVPAGLDLNENAHTVVKNICCVGAGYVGKSWCFGVVALGCAASASELSCSYRDFQGPPTLVADCRRVATPSPTCRNILPATTTLKYDMILCQFSSSGFLISVCPAC